MRRTMDHITSTALTPAALRWAPQEQGLLTAKAEPPVLTPRRLQRGQTWQQDNDNTRPSPLRAAGTREPLTHDHDVELEALFHGFPPQLLQDGVDAHVAEVRSRLVRPRRRRLLGAGIPRSVRHAGSVAGNGLWTCGGKHRVVRGAAPGRESQELPASSEAGVKHV